MKRPAVEFTANELRLAKAAGKFANATKARKLLESLRWPEGPICPRCEFDEVYKLRPKKQSKSSARQGVYKCAACRNQFTVTVGTMFEGSRIPLSKWVMAVYILCSTKEVISNRQLQRMVGISYTSAWRMAKRLRYALGARLPLRQSAARCPARAGGPECRNEHGGPQGAADREFSPPVRESVGTEAVLATPERRALLFKARPRRLIENARSHRQGVSLQFRSHTSRTTRAVSANENGVRFTFLRQKN